MFGGGTVLTVVLLLVGSATLMVAVAGGHYGRAVHVAIGVVLVLVGHLLRAVDTLGLLPDVLIRGVDDEDAVATLLGLTALLLGGLLILQPMAVVVDLRTHLALAIFALLLLSVLVVHVIATFSGED